MSYTVHHKEHGKVVRGPIPATDFVALVNAWKDEGYDILDPLLAKSLEATIVVTSDKGIVPWRKSMGIEVAPVQEDFRTEI